MKLLNDLLRTTFEFEKDVNNIHLRKFLFIITELGSSIGAAIIMCAIAIISGYESLIVFVPIYITQLTISEVIKFTLKSPRPKTIVKRNLWGMTFSSGAFPSGHTSNIFTIATTLTIYYKFSTPLTLSVFAIAGIVAISRIFLGKHYLIDIIGGALLGIFISVLGSYTLANLLPMFI